MNADSNPVSIENLALLSGENLLDTLTDNGLILPEALEQDKENTESALKTIVADIQRGVTTADRIPYNYTELAELARRVMGVSAQNNKSVAASYTLVNSTVIGSWSNTYTGYNCYGYSIGNHVYKDPGYHSNQSFSMSLPIASMADLVIADPSGNDWTHKPGGTNPLRWNYSSPGATTHQI